MLKKKEIEKKKKGSDNRLRIRQFSFIVYEDSAPLNWREELAQIPCYAILHNKDLNLDGTPKKEHYHILVCMDNPVTEKTIKEIALKLGAANGKYEKVSSFRSYARYLCHLDNLDKYQYERSSVISYGGITDYEEIIESKADNLNTVKQIINYCRINYIDSYARLIDISILEYPNWFRLLCCPGYGNLVKSYIKSDYWTRRSINNLKLT